MSDSAGMDTKKPMATVVLTGGMNDRLRLYIPMHRVSVGMKLCTPLTDDNGNYKVLNYTVTGQQDEFLFLAEYDGMSDK